MSALILGALGWPLALAAIAFVMRRHAWTAWLPIAGASGLLVLGVGCVTATSGGRALVAGAGLLRVDALSAWLLATIGAVAMTALWGGLPRHPRDRSQLGVFATLLCLFLAAMTLAVVADNVGLMWVAIELTTITTAFLVASRGGRDSLEAAWKYVVLGALGVAIAFLGIVLLAAAGAGAGEASLSWTGLMTHASALNPTLTRAAGALAVLGFATKAGLAPMHSWLPDAHSQAPASVSGLMSGVLLSVAFYVILRVQAITDAALGPDLMRLLLVVAGLASLAVAAGLALTQRDYKRLLAYSSIEHMGLLALGAAVGGPVAIGAVLLHIVGHGLLKAAMFVTAGRILAATGSHHIADVRSLLRRRPDLGAPFLVGAAGLLGLPPFATFFTEVAIIASGFARGLVWQMLLACALLLVMFAGIARHALAMTVGPENDAVGRESGEPASRQLPVLAALAVAAVIAFVAPLAGALADAVAALGGAR